MVSQKVRATCRRGKKGEKKRKKREKKEKEKNDQTKVWIFGFLYGIMYILDFKAFWYGLLNLYMDFHGSWVFDLVPKARV